eukprot:8354462-Lingulodinium_polyedra.AAC.1
MGRFPVSLPRHGGSARRRARRQRDSSTPHHPGARGLAPSLSSTARAPTSATAARTRHSLPRR